MKACIRSIYTILFGTVIACAACSRQPVEPVPPLGDAEKAAVDVIVNGQSDLAMDLYGQLRQEDKNLFFSPYSVAMAMSMTYGGARGSTEQQMATVLHLPGEQEKDHTAIKNLSGLLMQDAESSKTQLAIANGLCVTGGGVSKDYKLFLANTYDAELFSGGLKQINAWASKKTNGKIDEILTELSADSVCVILNAVYFKADWEDEFDEKFTKPGDFRLTDRQTVKVPLMRHSDDFSTATVPGASAISLPYKSDTFSMVVILPEQLDGLADMEQALDTESLRTLLKELDAARPDEIVLTLPKWKMETEYDLVPTFKSLGMVLPFARGDLSGIGSVPGDFRIAQIKHKAFLQVDEKGSEAAAVTAVEVSRESVSAPPRHFRVDRPFMFLIRHNASGTILFMGRVVDPTK